MIQLSRLAALDARGVQHARFSGIKPHLGCIWKRHGLAWGLQIKIGIALLALEDSAAGVIS